MIRKIVPKYMLLHAHGTAGPNRRRSYIQMGTYVSKKNAAKGARNYNLDGYKIVLKSRVKRSKLKGVVGLYYITK